jgi:hypothetical protein
MKGLQNLGLISYFEIAKSEIYQLPRFDRVALVFWMLGPFFLLIERTAGDIWLSLIALMFIVKTTAAKKFDFLKTPWVVVMSVFLLVCFCSSMISNAPKYSFLETLAFTRFPLFAMAICFWLAKSRLILDLY